MKLRGEETKDVAKTILRVTFSNNVVVCHFASSHDDST